MQCEQECPPRASGTQAAQQHMCERKDAHDAYTHEHPARCLGFSAHDGRDASSDGSGGGRPVGTSRSAVGLAPAANVIRLASPASLAAGNGSSRWRF